MATPADVVREFYAKLTAGDAPGALALMTDDVEWIPMMDDKVDGRGPQKVLEGMLVPAMSDWTSFNLNPGGFVAEGTGSSRSAASTALTVLLARWLRSVTPMPERYGTARSPAFRQYIDTARIEAARHR